jgi:hypothetical protein
MIEIHSVLPEVQHRQALTTSPVSIDLEHFAQLKLGVLCTFLGAFAKLRKATISFVMSIRLSVHTSVWNNSAPTGRIFTKFDI